MSLKKWVEIIFKEPVAQEKLDELQDCLIGRNITIRGHFGPRTVYGVAESTDMFNLFKSPILRALKYAGLEDNVLKLDIANEPEHD